MRETKTCSKCGSMMEFRLGEFECPSCSRYEDDIRDADRRRRTAEGDTALLGQQQYPSTPPAPGLYAGPQAAVSYVSLEDNPRYKALMVEKNVLFGLYILGALIAMVPMPGVTGGVEEPWVVSLLSGIASVLIMWLVLYTKAIWAKWCCLISTSLQAVMVVLSALVLLFIPDTFAGLGAGGTTLVVLMYLAIVIAIGAFMAWVVSIIWRDIKLREAP